jgi:hypothetical protein
MQSTRNMLPETVRAQSVDPLNKYLTATIDPPDLIIEISRGIDRQLWLVGSRDAPK